jgi:hypothetical protein
MNDQKDEEKGLEALQTFFQQFGPLEDIYSKIFWEVFLEELYEIKSE